MDAVIFFEEYERLCDSHNTCENCPLNGTTGCSYNPVRGFRDINITKVVEIVENWSKENPEELGKKYIIEIDKVDRDRGRKQYHIKGAQGFWISDGNLTGLEEYKEHDACKDCKYEDKTEKEEPCVRCRYAYRDKWEAKR